MGKPPFFNNSVWILWLLFGVMTIIIIGLLLFRKYLQNKYAVAESIDTKQLNLKENEYFYQSPLYIIDNQTLPVYGKQNITYTIKFANRLHKVVSLFGVMPHYSTYLKSENTVVKLVPKKIFTLRYQYNVYVDEELVGQLEMKKLIKDGGMKQKLPYNFYYGEETYSFHNGYMSSQTTLSNSNEEVLLQADRSVFDLFKNQQTQKRGEQHQIQIVGSQLSPELLLALYIQTMINKQVQQST